MNKTLRHGLSEVTGIADAWARIAIGGPLLPYALLVAAIGVAAFVAATLTTILATGRRRRHPRRTVPPRPPPRAALQSPVPPWRPHFR